MIVTRQKLGMRGTVLVMLCIGLTSCSRDKSETEAARHAKAEYLYASACAQNEGILPESCSPDASHLIGRYRVGNIDLRIPRQYLVQPATEIRKIERASYSFCWPELEAYSTGCGTRLNKIRLFATEATYVAPPASSKAVRRKTKEVLLAERIAEYYTGPYRLENTRIDEYRHRNENGVAPVFSFRATDDLRIARCDHKAYGRCIITVWDIKGLNIRYEFEVSLIRDWQGIDAAVVDTVISFVVAANSVQ